MPSVRRSAGLAALAAALASPVLASAQTTVTADIATASAWVWRGLTFTNRPVLQPDAYLTTVAGKGSVVLGAAANVEPVAYDRPGDLSLLGAESGTLVTGTSLWGEYARPVGHVATAVGVAGYVYPQANGIAATYNTAEVYARAAVSGPLAPTVTVYYDVVRIRGAYAEGSLRHTVPAGAHASLAFGAAAGMSLGQGADVAGHESAYFAGNGLTHVDLSTAASWTAGAMVVTPSVHALLLRDAATRLTGPDERHATRLTLGVTLGWSQRLTH